MFMYFSVVIIWLILFFNDFFFFLLDFAFFMAFRITTVNVVHQQFSLTNENDAIRLKWMMLLGAHPLLGIKEKKQNLPSSFNIFSFVGTLSRQPGRPVVFWGASGMALLAGQGKQFSLCALWPLLEFCVRFDCHSIKRTQSFQRMSKRGMWRWRRF